MVPPFPPDTVDPRFDAHIDALIPSPQELAAARQAAMGVGAALRRTFRPRATEADGRADHLVAGAIGKRTAVRPMPAVDLLYLLPGDGLASDTLSRIDRALRTARSGAAVACQDGCVLVEEGGFLVAVSPAVERNGAFGLWRNGGWLLTNPVAETAALRLSDSLSGGRTTRLLALLKSWKQACGVPITSFALEVLAREFMSEQLGEAPISSWPAVLSNFFAWARHRTPKSFDLPGGLARLAIDDGWHPAAEAGYWRCILASRHAASGDDTSELGEWRRLFGSRFAEPAPFNIWNVRSDLG